MLKLIGKVIIGTTAVFGLFVSTDIVNQGLLLEGAAVALLSISILSMLMAIDTLESQ